jgi:hypothetical protein
MITTVINRFDVAFWPVFIETLRAGLAVYVGNLH